MIFAYISKYRLFLCLYFSHTLKGGCSFSVTFIFEFHSLYLF